MTNNGISITLDGDWERLQRCLFGLANNLNPDFIAQFDEDGEFVVEKMKGHIAAQDLGWAPLSPNTIRLKGHSTIYVETGTIYGSIEAKKISSGAGGCTIIVGVPAGAGHPSGYSMGTIMGWLEYGTSKQPPRPLIRPVYDEVQSILQEHWKSLFLDEVHRYA